MREFSADEFEHHCESSCSRHSSNEGSDHDEIQ